MKKFKLLIVMPTYNRLEYTKRTLKNFWDNTSDSADYYFIISDNASTDGTRDYVKNLHKRARIDDYLFHPENFYPGKACNYAWQKGLWKYQPTHLMRLDNDMELTKDWDLKAAEYFEAIPELGQLGLEHEAIETPEADLTQRTIKGKTVNTWPGCVGGPMIMPYFIWQKGIRYDEAPWSPGTQEDSRLSAHILGLGYLVGHAQEELGRTFANRSNWKDYPDYYKQTMTDRGIEESVKFLEELL